MVHRSQVVRGEDAGRGSAHRVDGVDGTRGGGDHPAQPTPRDLHTACGLIPAGTVGATYAKCIGVVDGHEVVSLEHVDRMADNLAPDWPTGRTGATDGVWRVIVDGEPSFDGEFEVGHRPGESASAHGLLATGMRAVNAIPWVCDAPPGIVDALHLPLTSPIGALHPDRGGVPAF